MGEQSKVNTGQGETNNTWSQKLKNNICKGKHLKTKHIDLKARAYDWFTVRDHYRPLSRSSWAYSAEFMPITYCYVRPPPCFSHAQLLSAKQNLLKRLQRVRQECCWVKRAQNKQRSGTVSHMHNSRFADAEVGRTLNQLTTLRSSTLRADWPGSSEDGSPQCGGFPEGSSQLN